MSFKVLVLSFAVMLLVQPMVALVKSQDKNECSTSCCGSHGIPGVPGIPGGPGRDGTTGPKGDAGSTGPVGTKGEAGDRRSGGPGTDGTPGPKGDIGSSGPVGPKGQQGNKGTRGPGTDGTPGPKGDIGSTGSVGSKGEQGNKGTGGPGTDGTPGPKGNIGSTGPVGHKGEPGDKGSDGLDLKMRSNWKQCAWKRNDGKDNGLIKDCVFNKKHDNTSLRVFYGGNLRIQNCDSCCKRWYFTFGGAECSKPMAIDGVVYMHFGTGAKEQNLHRHRNIEGYCNQVPKGHVRVGFWVGNCAGYGNADAATGWNSVSRIVIEEVPPPQA